MERLPFDGIQAALRAASDGFPIVGDWGEENCMRTWQEAVAHRHVDKGRWMDISNLLGKFYLYLMMTMLLKVHHPFKKIQIINAVNVIYH